MGRGAGRRLWLLLAVHARRRWGAGCSRQEVDGVVDSVGDQARGRGGAMEGAVRCVGGSMERTVQVGSLVWLN